MDRITRDGLVVATFEIRERTNWMTVLGATFVLVAYLSLQSTTIWIQAASLSTVDISADQYLYLVRDTYSTLIPLLAVVFTYRAVAKEKESGALRLLLSLPFRRTDVVVGKFASAFVIVAFPVAISLAIATVVASSFGTVSIGSVLVFVAATLGLTLVFVGVVLTVSIVADTGWRSLSAGFGVIVLLVYVAPPFLTVLAVGAGLENETIQSLVTIFPTRSYGTILSFLLDTRGANPPGVPAVLAAVSMAVWVVTPFCGSVWFFSDADL